MLKQQTFNSLQFYSKYYFRLLSDCEYLRSQEKGHSALFALFSILENIIKSSLNDFKSNFNILVKKLFELNIISEIEYNFLNNQEIGIRKIRNIFAHGNLSKYDLKYDDEPATYPLTENETCLKFYDQISEILFSIILKIIDNEMNSNLNLKMNNNFTEKIIEELKFKIIIRSPEELMKFKGIGNK